MTTTTTTTTTVLETVPDLVSHRSFVPASKWLNESIMAHVSSRIWAWPLATLSSSGYLSMYDIWRAAIPPGRSDITIGPNGTLYLREFSGYDSLFEDSGTGDDADDMDVDPVDPVVTWV